MSKHDFNYYGKDYPSVNSFAEAEALYNKIVPVRGARKTLDIRPLGTDRRSKVDTSYRVVKVDDDTYTLTEWYEWNPVRTEKIEDNLGVTWKRDGSCTVTGKRYGNNRYLNFTSQVLPDGVFLSKYDTKIYLSISRSDRTDYYFLSMQTVNPATLNLAKDGNGEWQVLNPVQEYRKRITGKIRAECEADGKLVEFEQYASTVWDMLTADVAKANKANYRDYWSGDSYHVKNILDDKDQWLKAACEMKQVRYLEYGQSHGYWANQVKDKFTSDKLRKSVYKIHRDKANTAPVPIGTRCRRHWLDKR